MREGPLDVTELKRLRLCRGDTLQDVADAVGSTKSYIWELEQGRTTNPGVGLTVALARHLGVSVLHLIGQDPLATQNPLGSSTYEMMRHLSDSDCRIVNGVARMLYERTMVGDT